MLNTCIVQVNLTCRTRCLFPWCTGVAEVACVVAWRGRFVEAESFTWLVLYYWPHALTHFLAACCCHTTFFSFHIIVLCLFVLVGLKLHLLLHRVQCHQIVFTGVHTRRSSYLNCRTVTLDSLFLNTSYVCVSLLIFVWRADVILTPGGKLTIITYQRSICLEFVTNYCRDYWCTCKVRCAGNKTRYSNPTPGRR